MYSSDRIRQFVGSWVNQLLTKRSLLYNIEIEIDTKFKKKSRNFWFFLKCWFTVKYNYNLFMQKFIFFNRLRINKYKNAKIITKKILRIELENFPFRFFWSTPSSPHRLLSYIELNSKFGIYFDAILKVFYYMY